MLEQLLIFLEQNNMLKVSNKYEYQLVKDKEKWCEYCGEHNKITNFTSMDDL